MLISTPKSQKTSGGLGNFHVNDWESGGKIRTGILHLVSRLLQGSDKDPTRLKK